MNAVYPDSIIHIVGHQWTGGYQKYDEYYETVSDDGFTQDKWFQINERFQLYPLPVNEKGYQKRDGEYVYSHSRECEPVKCLTINESVKCQQIGKDNNEHAFSVHLLERDVGGTLCVTGKT